MFFFFPFNFIILSVFDYFFTISSEHDKLLVNIGGNIARSVKLKCIISIQGKPYILHHKSNSPIPTNTDIWFIPVYLITNNT